MVKVWIYLQKRASLIHMFIGNFTEAQSLIKKAVTSVKGSGLQLLLRILVHPTELVTGGLSQIEKRVFH